MYVETHTHTHWVQEATECRAVGVRLQEWNHPKSRLLLSLFNCWLGQLFEGPFNCHSDGILTTKQLFFTFLLIYPFMTPIKTTHTPANAALFVPSPTPPLPVPGHTGTFLTQVCLSKFKQVLCVKKVDAVMLKCKKKQYVVSHTVEIFTPHPSNSLKATCSNKSDLTGN